MKTEKKKTSEMKASWGMFEYRVAEGRCSTSTGPRHWTGFSDSQGRGSETRPWGKK